MDRRTSLNPIQPPVEPATLRKVAAEAGVSLMVASRALRGDVKGIRRDAVQRAERIRAIARKLNYRRDLAATATRRRRFGSIAIVLSSGDARRSNLPADLLAAVTDALDAHDMHLAVARLSDAALTDAARVPRLLRDLGADGLLVNYNQWVPPAMNQLIERHAIPAVWINDKREHDAVYADEFDAARRATAHLLAMGHRRIAYVGHPESPQRHYSEADRRSGYAAAMIDAGLTPRPLIESASADKAALLARALRSSERPTAIVTYNITLITLAWLIAAESGLSCPRDLSLMTFSGQPAHFGRAVSMMRVPDAEVGASAVRMLLNRIAHGGQEQPSQPIAHTLDLGATCAPPGMCSTGTSPSV